MTTDETTSRGVRVEERAIKVAMACSAIGAVLKLSAGVVTGSMSLVSSAVDSLGDLLVSSANLFVVRYGDMPADEDHNYGHAKIEGLGAMFEGGFIFAAGLFIIYEAVHKALLGEVSHDVTLGIVVMVPVLGMTIGTVTYLRKVAKATGSLTIKSDALHYLTDVWVNVGVLVSLVLVKLTGVPLIDTVISIAIALFMLHASVGVVREGFAVIMDTSLERATVTKIEERVRDNPSVLSFHDLRTRRGRVPHIDLHVVVPPHTTAKELHDLFVALRDDIRTVAGPGAIVNMHADPAE